jgi:hypothetical protein
MKYIKVPNSDMNASEISLGCMRISDMPNQEISTLIQAGWHHFGHADIAGWKIGGNFPTLNVIAGKDDARPNWYGLLWLSKNTFWRRG